MYKLDQNTNRMGLIYLMLKLDPPSVVPQNIKFEIIESEFIDDYLIELPILSTA
jgi:hypothetical protein